MAILIIAIKNIKSGICVSEGMYFNAKSPTCLNESGFFISRKESKQENIWELNNG